MLIADEGGLVGILVFVTSSSVPIRVGIRSTRSVTARPACSWARRLPQAQSVRWRNGTAARPRGSRYGWRLSYTHCASQPRTRPTKWGGATHLDRARALIAEILWRWSLKFAVECPYRRSHGPTSCTGSATNFRGQRPIGTIKLAWSNRVQSESQRVVMMKSMVYCTVVQRGVLIDSPMNGGGEWRGASDQ
jgi:hypothetical protein